ncbi:hypothetical protein LT493_10980 [Streptomyces tricolor]|nr:hypothetical protein [Streptomyces tricolor]
MTGFAKNGLFAMGTDRLTVKRVIAEHNGQWGIAQQHFTRGVLRNNTAPRQRGTRAVPREQREGRAGRHGQQGRGGRPQPAGGQPDRHHRPPAAQPRRHAQLRPRQLRGRVRRRRREQAADGRSDRQRQPGRAEQQVLPEDRPAALPEGAPASC